MSPPGPCLRAVSLTSPFACEPSRGCKSPCRACSAFCIHFPEHFAQPSSAAAFRTLVCCWSTRLCSPIQAPQQGWAQENSSWCALGETGAVTRCDTGLGIYRFAYTSATLLPAVLKGCLGRLCLQSRVSGTKSIRSDDTDKSTVMIYRWRNGTRI